MTDVVLTKTVLPRISEECLTPVGEARPLGAITRAATDGDFSFEFA